MICFLIPPSQAFFPPLIFLFIAKFQLLYIINLVILGPTSGLKAIKALLCTHLENVAAPVGRKCCEIELKQR